MISLTAFPERENGIKKGDVRTETETGIGKHVAIKNVLRSTRHGKADGRRRNISLCPEEEKSFLNHPVIRITSLLLPG